MKQGIGYRAQGLVMVVFIFIAVFASFATPAEAVKLCTDKGPGTGIGGGSPELNLTEKNTGQPRTAGEFLTLGCGSVRDLSTGQEIACYHSLNGVVAVILKAYDLILGIVGSLALLMFVWGGFQWLISGGSDKRITAGMTTLKNAVIGLVIVFGAWIGMNFVIAALNPGQGIGDIRLAGAAENWWAMKGGAETYCYRPLSTLELAAALAKPVVVAPPAVAAPPSPGISECKGPKKDDRLAGEPCGFDPCNCASGRCLPTGQCDSDVKSPQDQEKGPGTCCFVTTDAAGISNREANRVHNKDECIAMIQKTEKVSDNYDKDFCPQVVGGETQPTYICFPRNALRQNSDYFQRASQCNPKISLNDIKGKGSVSDTAQGACCYNVVSHPRILQTVLTGAFSIVTKSACQAAIQNVDIDNNKAYWCDDDQSSCGSKKGGTGDDKEAYVFPPPCQQNKLHILIK